MQFFMDCASGIQRHIDWAVFQRLESDGNLVELDAYFVNLKWHDEERQVLALEAETMPLIGMSMLWGSRVSFDAEDGGQLTVDVIP